MAARENFDVGRILKLRAAIIPQRGDVRQSREDIDFRQGQRSLADALRLGSNCRPQLSKQTPLDFDDLLLGIENLRFVFL